MTVKGGTIPACAACKYQRRRCSAACPLAPYFPANQPKMFQNVHRLFGVSNVTKTLDKLKTKDQKEEAMRSIIYEAEMRERFPVNGCCTVITHLLHQLHFAKEQLDLVSAHLDACRNNNNIPGSSSSLNCWMDDAAHYGFLLSQNDDGLSNTTSSTLSSIQAQMDALGIQNTDSFDFEAQQFNSNALFDAGQFYNETKIEATDTFESSPESSVENAARVAEVGCRRDMRGGDVAAEHGCRRDMRTAAAGFGLTTVN